MGDNSGEITVINICQLYHMVTLSYLLLEVSLFTMFCLYFYYMKIRKGDFEAVFFVCPNEF